MRSYIPKIDKSAEPIAETMNTAMPLRDGQIRDINLRQLNHGYLLEVGCQRIAIESKYKLIEVLTAYIGNPQDVEESYHKGELL